MKSINIGVLAFHGDVLEHVAATKNAAGKLKLNINISLVRTKKELKNLNGLIIPGGESTTIQKLCEREDMISEIKNVKNIFGTCAGAIILAKLKLLNIEVERNAYGRQNESFEKTLQTVLGKITAVFIRAPKIKNASKEINILSKSKDDILACEQRVKDKYYLVTCFHPELTTTKFHEYFLGQIINLQSRN